MTKPKKNPLKITPIKGRPMLHWVGKKPLDVERYFQHSYAKPVGVDNPPAEPSYLEFVKSDYNLLFHGDTVVSPRSCYERFRVSSVLDALKGKNHLRY